MLSRNFFLPLHKTMDATGTGERQLRADVKSKYKQNNKTL